MLSNISRYFVENYEKVPGLRSLFTLFDGLVFSAPVGMVKPTPEIFHYLLDKFHLRAEECTFIDDSELNVEGARNVGIKAILFQNDVEKLKKEILMT